MKTAKLFDALAIRDTTAHHSASINLGESDGALFAAVNGLNQTVSLQYEGSMDGTTWFNLGNASAVTAGSKHTNSVSDAWPMARVTATCSVSPTTGSLALTASTRRHR